jgi:hypothetical protein
LLRSELKYKLNRNRQINPACDADPAILLIASPHPCPADALAHIRIAKVRTLKASDWLTYTDSSVGCHLQNPKIPPLQLHKNRTRQRYERNVLDHHAYVGVMRKHTDTEGMRRGNRVRQCNR